MNCVAVRLLLLSALFATAIGCLPGLGGGGGGGGACCGAPQAAAPAPVYAAAPLAPAPFASPVFAAPPSPVAPVGFQQPLPVHNGYAAAATGNFQNGYVAEPVRPVQPLPLMGQPVAYETPATLVVAPTQEEQVLSKVLPASAVLEEHVVESAAASQNSIVSSIISQVGYGDEESAPVPVAVTPHRASSSSSSSSSASASAEHRAGHQVRVPSASSSVEVSEHPVPHTATHQLVQVETAPVQPAPASHHAVPVKTASAPYHPVSVQTVQVETAPVQPVPAPHQPVSVQTIQTETAPVQPAPAAYHPIPVQTVPVPHQPVSVQTVQVETAPVQPIPVQTAPVQPAPASFQPSPVETVPAQPETVAEQTHIVTETKVVAEEDRIEATGGSDYDQPTHVAANEQATVNELLANLDTVTVPSNLDFNQVTVEPNQNTASVIVQTDGDDYDTPLNEDRKDVPTPEPTVAHVEQPVPQPVVPEESAPIIPQPLPDVYPVNTHKPAVHLQPLVPAVRVELTTAETPVTPDFESTVEVTQVPLQPEPAVIQTITEQPIAEVTVEVLPTTPEEPASQFFENITSREDATDGSETTSQPEPAPEHPEPVAQEEKSAENKLPSTDTDVVPNLGEYGSKFAKVQGTETKQVSQPIEIETIENANPYRKYWIF